MNYDYYAYELADYIESVIENPSSECIEEIRSFWDFEDKWETIINKFSTEGSTWYVWWMDGVVKYAESQNNL